ncbi:MAG: response regulator [Calothrix sp. MO_167.B42]|nr:response regulator [Calothrix sp. MO_167.B42]
MLPAFNNLRISLDNINYGTLKSLRPLSLLRQLANSHDSTYLQVLSNRVSWSIYLEQGKIIYATHSVEPLDRLERHLRRLEAQISTLPSDIYTQLQLIFAESSHNQFTEHPDYQGINWLIEQQYISLKEAALLIQEMVKEVIESFLLIQQGSYEFTNKLYHIPKFCRLNTEKTIQICQDKLQIWQLLGDKISSPYQRPYLWNLDQKSVIKFTNGLDLSHCHKGLSIRHLAIMTNQDELTLAINIYPYITGGQIILHEPDPPFDRLPKIPGNTSIAQSVFNNGDNSSGTIANPQLNREEPQVDENPSQQTQSNPISNDSDLENNLIIRATLNQKKLYTIVSVDDSLAILKQITQYLANDIFSVVTINEPVKAPLSIIRYRPDLILLDINMAEMDGYELCSLIRNNSMFKNTPIIMVTANKGIFNRVKAKMVGASGFMIKPFNRVDLLKMVFAHLA